MPACVSEGGVKGVKVSLVWEHWYPGGSHTGQIHLAAHFCPKPGALKENKTSNWKSSQKLLNSSTIPTDILITTSRPDLVMINGFEEETNFLELTCSFVRNIRATNARKTLRYTIHTAEAWFGRCWIHLYTLTILGWVKRVCDHIVKLINTFVNIRTNAVKCIKSCQNCHYYVPFLFSTPILNQAREINNSWQVKSSMCRSKLCWVFCQLKYMLCTLLYQLKYMLCTLLYTWKSPINSLQRNCISTYSHITLQYIVMDLMNCMENPSWVMKVLCSTT